MQDAVTKPMNLCLLGNLQQKKKKKNSFAASAFLKVLHPDPEKLSLSTL